jgi:hypothetical protein
MEGRRMLRLALHLAEFHSDVRRERARVSAPRKPASGARRKSLARTERIAPKGLAHR